jgi:hypothetical protein
VVNSTLYFISAEYLEANFYSCAAYGVPIDSSLTGGGPSPTGCSKANLSPQALAYATAITKDEIAHVTLLRSALGSAAVSQPQIDIGPAFSAAANAAFGATLSPSFSPYGDDVLFYHGAFIFEDVGVTAYKGAATLITSKAYLDTAAGILAVEAYHGGSIRTLLFPLAQQTVFPYGTTVANIIGAISALRAKASNATDDLGLFTATGGYIVAPTDANAVAYSRSTSQVLSVVYLGGAGKGGFFPNGLNGSIK